MAVTREQFESGMTFDQYKAQMTRNREQFERNERLRSSLDTAFAGAEKYSKLVDGLDRFAQQAHDIISSPKARTAFDVSRESPEAAARSGH